MKRRHSNTTMDTMFTFKVGIIAALHCFGDNGDSQYYSFNQNEKNDKRSVNKLI
ncbi:hypothetical protein N9C33_00215 [Crocinitomicaceae bacterium]|nr:hypothetical protein [Crocinitomicaceae bacterium]